MSKSVLASFLFTLAVSAQTRPPIVGVAHISLRTDNLDAAKNFYGKVLGYQEAFQKEKKGASAKFTFFKVNDHQYIQVLPELSGPEQDRLIEMAFETSDAKKLRDYLAGKGVAVPAKVAKDVNGNMSFTIRDPDGYTLEFVQYLKGSMHGKQFGKLMPKTRVSERMIHVGMIVKDRTAAEKLYRDVLGFKLQWYGGSRDDRTDWVSMRVPEGTDWIEFMLNVNNPSTRTRGVMNHLALGVPSVETGHKTVTDRGMTTEPPKIGRDGKWQLNLYDPNQTRAELMEPKPVQPPCCSPMHLD